MKLDDNNDILKLFPNTNIRFFQKFPFVLSKNGLRLIGNRHNRSVLIKKYIAYKLTIKFRKKSLNDLEILLYATKTNISTIMSNNIVTNKCIRIQYLKFIILQNCISLKNMTFINEEQGN